MITAYPLSWPVDYKRSQEQKSSRFKTTLGRARDFVIKELEIIDAADVIISSNIPLKQNGDMYADLHRYKNDDTGVAVYFKRNGQQIVLCCDTYKLILENMYAIGRTLQALRQIDRDGVSDFLNRTFTGFKALPERTGATPWYQVLDYASCKKRYDANYYLGSFVGDCYAYPEQKYKRAVRKCYNKYKASVLDLINSNNLFVDQLIKEEELKLSGRIAVLKNRYNQNKCSNTQ